MIKNIDLKNSKLKVSLGSSTKDLEGNSLRYDVQYQSKRPKISE